MGASVQRLKRRPEFLRVASARRRFAAPGMVVQARRRSTDDPVADDGVRYGLTVSRKVGNAVTRNRARRRLRAAAIAVLPRHAAPGHDLVLIGRADTPSRPYESLISDLTTALKRLGIYREDGPYREHSAHSAHSAGPTAKGEAR